MTTWTTLLDNLSFPEGPRWYRDRLWLSDFYTHRVIAVDLEGNAETVAEVPGQPSGLGWLPDGRLLVVSMTDRRLLRLDPDGLVEHADLNGVATYHCNDMVVDASGRAYVGNFGFDHYSGQSPTAARLARVQPDGQVDAVAEDLLFPNGSVVTDDGNTLIVAESRGQRLSAFDIGPDGGLSNHRIWADLKPQVPDGICLDASGGVWCADPRNNEVIRVVEGGSVTHRLSTGDRGAYACMLGGPERRRLFVCVNSGSGSDAAAKRDGAVIWTDVEFTGAGWPGNES
ncbi:MAG: SMP-30/gluconolactonase/LRE family protein [Gammaproteobacteria bacterium]|nr:SMP-30/gluconolactonase/LRE family protein [Gammaproteobacteria bacterium]